MSHLAQSRMHQRGVCASDVHQCRMRGVWMRNAASGRVVLCWRGVVLGVKPFSKAIATVMQGSLEEYVRFRQRGKNKRKYKDDKHLRKWTDLK